MQATPDLVMLKFALFLFQWAILKVELLFHSK